MSPERSAEAGHPRVFLADQHPIIRRGLRAMLEKDPTITVVGEAGTAAEAQARVRDAQPDVVLLDLMPAPGSGLELIRFLKRTAPAPGVLVVTAEPVGQVLLPALEAGADGFINKNANCTDYTEAVHRVAAGQLFLCPCALSFAVRVLFDAERSRDFGVLASLSAEEREVLYGTVCGFSNHEIADEMHLSVNLVARLKNHLREKLSAHRREDLVAFAMRVDLLHSGSRHHWIDEPNTSL